MNFVTVYSWARDCDTFGQQKAERKHTLRGNYSVVVHEKIVF